MIDIDNIVVVFDKLQIIDKYNSICFKLHHQIYAPNCV